MMLIGITDCFYTHTARLSLYLLDIVKFWD